LDEYRVRFYLREPYAPLLDSLAQVYLGMASPRALTEWGPGEYQFHQVGTGPYRFVEYIPNDHITLEKNQDYTWGPSIYEQKQAQIQRITFQFYEDPATRSLALESGDVDVIGEVPPRDASRLDQDPSFRLHPIPIPGQPLQYFFNTQRPPTDDLQVRLALIHAVDRERIVEIIFGTYSPVANGPLSAPTMGAFADHPSPSYDPTRAILLLEAAGWTRDKGQDVWVKDGSPLSLHIVAPPWGSNPAVAQLLKAAWEEIGTEVTIEIAPGFGPLKQIRDSGQYDLIGLNFFGTDPDLLRPFYQSDGIYNWSGITDHELDQWLELGSQVTLDQSERLAYYRLTWDRIIDAAVLLPVRDYVNLVVARSDIEGLRFSSQGWFPFLIDLRIQPSEQ
jgi:peptide/nickel transport system substrate-binding protein